MTTALVFAAPKVKLEDVDLPRIGSEIGVGEDELHAVLEVETSGGAADRQGRLKMLFEPHVFYRNLKGEKRDRAVREGLAYPNWRSGYPADSYPRLLKALAIDETAALKACSWGLGQILGENHKAAGYPTPQAMVHDFTLDEDNHLEAMIRFIKSKGLHRALVRHDWHAFAHGYNGAGYAKHNYHGRLAAAFAKWQKIKDTPWDGKTQRSVAIGDKMIDVTPTVVSEAPAPAANVPIALPAPADKPSVKQDSIIYVVLAFIVAAAAAAYQWAMHHLPEIFLITAGLIVFGLAAFRLIKGRWPWTSHKSIGVRLPVLSLPSLPRSGASLEQLSRHLEGLSALSPATTSRQSSTSRRRRKPSAARSPKTRRPPKSSRRSSKITATKSLRARRSKSKN